MNREGDAQWIAGVLDASAFFFGDQVGIEVKNIRSSVVGRLADQFGPAPLKHYDDAVVVSYTNPEQVKHIATFIIDGGCLRCHDGQGFTKWLTHCSRVLPFDTSAERERFQRGVKRYLANKATYASKAGRENGVPGTGHGGKHGQR